MANSSDWLGALAAEGDGLACDPGGPGWLTLLDTAKAATFREATPFAPSEAEAPVLAPAEPAPLAPDPVAEACARAYADGEAAGRAAAEAEAAARASRQRALRLNFRALDEAALGVLAEDLAATVAALCEGVLGEAASDRAALIDRCHAAARRIGGVAEALTLHLNPGDIALLDEDALPGWKVVGDAALEPGSLVIEGPEGTVSDGPAEWRRAIAAAVRG